MVRLKLKILKMLNKYKEDIEAFDVFLKEYTQSKICLDNELKSYKAMGQLHESMTYSLFSGGKRFRPLLSLFVARTFLKDNKDFFGFAGAIEMVHTYSLIHDDLPCMDDDDERRGKPTNHKLYGEAVALLAGDCLLTEAFHLLTESYKGQPSLCVELCGLLSKAAGFCGMVGGQVIDIEALKTKEINKFCNYIKFNVFFNLTIKTFQH